MLSKLTARPFASWLLLFAALLALGTVFFSLTLWLTIPVIAGQGCVSGGFCGPMAPVLGLWLQPALLIAAGLTGALAFYRRGMAVGSRLWGLMPLALLLPNLPPLFVLGNLWGADLGTVFLFFPRWSLLELTPLLALGLLLCFEVEYMPGFGGSIARTRLYGSVPIGLLYAISCVWICSDLVLSLSPHLGISIGAVHSLRDLLHFPLSLAEGKVLAGLPPQGTRPDMVVSLATVVNLVVLAVLVLALVLDSSNRLRRTGAQIFMVDSDDGDARPLFRSRGSFRD